MRNWCWGLKTTQSLVPSRQYNARGMSVLRGKWTTKNWEHDRLAEIELKTLSSKKETSIQYFSNLQ